MPRRAHLPKGIREAAIALAREQTFAATTIEDIAGRVGVSKAAVYYHFRAKEQLLASLVGPLLDALEQLVERASEPESRLRDPRALLRAYLDVLVEHRDVVPLVVQDVSVINHPVLAGRPDEADRRLRALLAESLNVAATAEPRATAALAALRRPVIVLPARDVRRFRRTLLAAATAALGLRAGKGDDAEAEAAAAEANAVVDHGWEAGESASFPASPASVSGARVFARKVLTPSSVGEDAVAIAVLATSEMVGYVVANSDPDSDVRVDVNWNDSRVGVEVVNDDAATAAAFGSLDAAFGSTDVPVRPHPVALVDSVATGWGIERRRGEQVRFWGEFPIAGAAQRS